MATTAARPKKRARRDAPIEIRLRDWPARPFCQLLDSRQEEDARDCGADERRRESDDDRWEVRPDPVEVVCLLLAVIAITIGTLEAN